MNDGRFLLSLLEISSRDRDDSRDVEISLLTMRAEDQLVAIFHGNAELLRVLLELDADLADRYREASCSLMDCMPVLINELRTIRLEAASGARKFFDDLLGAASNVPQAGPSSP